MLNTFEPDACCNTPLIRELARASLVDADTWICPKCGCTWKSQIVEGIKHWSPVPMIEVLRV